MTSFKVNITILTRYEIEVAEVDTPVQALIAADLYLQEHPNLPPDHTHRDDQVFDANGHLITLE